MNHAEEIEELVTNLAAAFQPYGWTDKSVDGYLIGLGDLPVDAVRRAIVAAIRTSERMPVPATLRRTILRASMTNPPPHVDTAWHEVETQMSTMGRDRKPTGWSHPLIGRAVDESISWFAACTAYNLDPVRRAFERTYNNLVDGAEKAALISTGFADSAALTQPALPELCEGDDQ
jgi:hypothetical protein